MKARLGVSVALGCAVACLGALIPAASSHEPPGTGDPGYALQHRGDRYVPKPPGTVEDLQLFLGPYFVPPGHDSNRVDVDLPLQNGMILAIEPGMRRVSDLREPAHQEAHIHHSHWFALSPGNTEDNYTRGMTEWIFGNGDEETRADYQERSNAEPGGPIYGQYVGASGPQLMIYMLHNKTAEPLHTYIVLDVTFKHGTMEQLNALGGRPHHDLRGLLFGRTFDVPRQAEGDGSWNTTEDHRNGAIEWTSRIEGTMIGTGGHLHPGGQRVVVENMGPADNPCPDTGGGFGGTRLLDSDALQHSGRFSEDFQMEVTHPAWRAPIHRGDRLRITGIYENKDHAWYTAMTHEGFYIDPQQPPRGRCEPYLVGEAARPRTRMHRHRHVHRTRRMVRSAGGRRRMVTRRRVHWHRHMHRERIEVTEGVPNRPFDSHDFGICGEEFGAEACDRPEAEGPPGDRTNTVLIADFLYLPGDRSLSGSAGQPVRVKRGTQLTFLNVDQLAGIRHSVTTCAWPCNGRYLANYPLADGIYDSDTLGYDPVDGGNPNPIAQTPADMPVGKYSYYCRIHPWMRGAFEVTE